MVVLFIVFSRQFPGPAMAALSDSASPTGNEVDSKIILDNKPIHGAAYQINLWEIIFYIVETSL
jgi:hypothetical protein